MLDEDRIVDLANEDCFEPFALQTAGSRRRSKEITPDVITTSRGLS